MGAELHYGLGGFYSDHLGCEARCRERRIAPRIATPPGGSYLFQCTLSAGPSALQALQRAYNVHEKLERGRRATERFRCPEMPSKTIPAV